MFFPGLAVGIGLFTTFFYVNKSIQTQVFLQVSYDEQNFLNFHSDY